MISVKLVNRYSDNIQSISTYSYCLSLNIKKENGWPHPPTADGKTRSCSYVLGARRRQKKDGEAEEDMAKYIQRRPRGDGSQMAWSLQDRQ